MLEIYKNGLFLGHLKIDWIEQYQKCRDVANQRRQKGEDSESGAVCEDDVTTPVRKTV
jgi:hypothetical protein